MRSRERLARCTQPDQCRGIDASNCTSARSSSNSTLSQVRNSAKSASACSAVKYCKLLMFCNTKVCEFELSQLERDSNALCTCAGRMAARFRRSDAR